MKYIRYRFKTKSVDDPRPLIDLGKINMPWWCTGYAGDNTYAIIVCYLPKNHGFVGDNKTMEEQDGK